MKGYAAMLCGLLVAFKARAGHVALNNPEQAIMANGQTPYV